MPAVPVSVVGTMTPVQTSARGPLGPGEDDPRSLSSGGEGTVGAPLGPGDDDPRSPGRVGESSGRDPLAPGELVGVDPHEGFLVLAPAPAGPGGMDTGPRQLSRIPLKR